MIKKITRLVCIALLPTGAWAQSTTVPCDAGDAATASRWHLGAGVAAINNGYVGAGTKILLLPIVDYAGDRVFIRGVVGGVHLLKSKTFAFDAIVTPGFNNIDRSDFSRADLARRGIDRSDRRIATSASTRALPLPGPGTLGS